MCLVGYAQQDTLQIDSLSADTANQKEGWSKAEKAGFLSAVAPGFGQIYNGKYWKAPIIWGGSAVLLTMTFNTHSTYREIRDIYESTDWKVVISRPDTFASVPISSQRQYKTLRDQYRRRRDYFIIFSGLLYSINIIDAVVDAHLSEFDLSDELSLKLNPDFSPINNKFAAGLSVSLNFK